MSAAKVDPLAELNRRLAIDLQGPPSWNPGAPLPAGTQALQDARDAVAELIAADREHDAALADFKALNRHIVEQGWLEVEADALRNAGLRFAAAQVRRGTALDGIGGAA